MNKETVIAFMGLIISTLSIQGIAMADNWSHVSVMNDSTSIGLDYQVVVSNNQMGPYGNIANPLWINVSGRFAGSESVSAVLINYVYSQAHGGVSKSQQVNQQVVSLTYAGNGRFTGRASSITVSATNIHDMYGDFYFQEIAIVIDGHWIKDPRTGNNFNISLENSRLK